jgi:glycerophosphoryl diester phosphodiesterase
MAHRGNMRRCPENTLAAFRQALADGADILETDLHLSRDGAFFCIHDATVDRTTDGTGRVEDMTVAQVKRLTASGGKAEFSYERVPLLAEAAAFIPDHVVFALELKSDRFLDRSVCARLAEELGTLGVRGHSMVLSFRVGRLNAFRSVAADVPTGLVSLFSIIPPADTNLVGPHWPLLLLNPLYVRIAHARGQLVCPLDPTPNPRLRYYLKLGVDALVANDPAGTLEEIARIQRTPGEYQRSSSLT